jgi:hypothetical protein
MSILLGPVTFVCGIKDCSEEGVKTKKFKVLYKDKNGKHRTEELIGRYK